MNAQPILIVALVGLLSGGRVVTQEPHDDGPMLGTGLLCILGPGTHWGADNTPVDPQQLYLKKAGFDPVANLTSLTASDGPDLRFDAMFGSAVGPIRIDAFSIGLDAIHVDTSSGEALLENRPTHWGAMTFSIEKGSTDGSETGVIQREVGRADGAGGDVFNYVFFQGDLAPGYALETKRELDGPELGLFAPMSTPKPEITGLDVHAATYLLDIGFRSLITAEPTVFFSVTTASVGAVPTAWWGGDAMASSGATILKTTWDGTRWSVPEPAATWADLSIDRTEEIDALSVDYDVDGSGVEINFEIVFSTGASTSLASQLMYIDMLASPFADNDPKPLKDASGNDATDGTRTGGGNMDAVCFEDPAVGQECGSVSALNWEFAFGTPSGIASSPFGVLAFPDPPVESTLLSSLFRSCPGGVAGCASQFVGWTASGRQDGMAIHIVAVGDDIGPTTAWFYHASVTRDASPSSYPGDPWSVELAYPSPVRPPGAMRCRFVWSVWLAMSTSGELSQSIPVRLRF